MRCKNIHQQFNSIQIATNGYKPHKTIYIYIYIDAFCAKY